MKNHLSRVKVAETSSDGNMGRCTRPRAAAGSLNSMPSHHPPIDASQSSRDGSHDEDGATASYVGVPATCADDFMSGPRAALDEDEDAVQETSYDYSESEASASADDEADLPSPTGRGNSTPPLQPCGSVRASSPLHAEPPLDDPQTPTPKDCSPVHAIPTTPITPYLNTSTTPTQPPRTPKKRLRPVPRGAPSTIEKIGRFTFRKGVRISDYRLPQPMMLSDGPESPSWQCRDGFDADEESMGSPRPLVKRLKSLSNTPSAGP